MILDPESKAALPWVMLSYALVVVLQHTSTAFQGLLSHVCNALRWLESQVTGNPMPPGPPAFTPSLHADAIALGVMAVFALVYILSAIQSRRQPPIDPPTPAQEPSP